MSIADEARAEAERLAQLGMLDESDPVGVFMQGWQASRKPEAAPSVTDRERLAKVIMDALDSLWVSDDRVLGKLHARDEILAAGFSRTSQPVQVEVTDDMAEKALRVYRMRTAERIDVGAFRAALSAALGGGDK